MRARRVRSKVSARGLLPAHPWSALLLVLLGGLGLSLTPAYGQAPLFLVNQDTEVRAISFRFMDHQTFEVDQLRAQMATSAPGLWDRVKDLLPLLSAKPYPFSPIELQKDVVRLRRFYQRNGFLAPSIDYPASQLDTTSNTIHVIFRIEEGPPLIIQDFGFFGPDSSYAIEAFEGPMRERWIRFRDRIALQTGTRYTEAEKIRIQDRVLSWMQEQGFAFARINTDVEIDSSYHTVDLRFYLDPGPPGTITEIEIEGNETVSSRVVTRELPFRVGDRFSSRALAEGQRQLFNLNLFRVALTEVPPQPRDSTVSVRIRLREARPRLITLQGGYGPDIGLNAEGQWTHRNFSGGARNLTVSLLAETGVLADTTTEGQAPARYRGAVSLRQPYLFTSKLTGIIGPFGEAARVPRLGESTWIQDLNTLEFGLETTVFYDLLPFRTISLRHAISRAIQAGQAAVIESDSLQTRDLYNKSILTLNATLGAVNDFLNPRRGVLVRPLFEAAGGFLLPGVVPGIQYQKASLELTGYLPLTRRSVLAARLFAGRVWPRGASRNQDAAPYENRFDPVRFYAGGGNDVRGWGFQQIGEVVFTSATVDTTGDGSLTATVQPEEVGGLAKLAGNLELRLPVPGLGRAWQIGTFLDAGYVYNDDLFNLADLRYGTGLGIRYQTPIGYLRLDLGFKLNPALRDLVSFEQLYLYRNDLITEADLDKRFLRRLRLHLSIGQVF
ncbi:MAG: outer membrane protein assembly factor [Bacteroidetes bacterium]|nr:MAG: outer membrane protein assembly factor [Bacteroidota bacterium]